MQCTHGLLLEACKALISDLQIMLYKQLTADMDRTNREAASTFEKKLVAALQECMVKARSSSSKIHSDQIWSAHFLFVLLIPMFATVTLKADIQAPSVISFSTSEIIF